MKQIIKKTMKELQDSLNFFTVEGLITDMLLFCGFLFSSLILKEYVFSSAESYLEIFIPMMIGMFGTKLLVILVFLIHNNYEYRKEGNHMAKLTIEQRIKKITESITKEESVIETSKEKIKAWNKELKLLQEEKNKEYASDFLKILSDNGLTTDEQKAEFMLMIEEKLKKEKSGLVQSNSTPQGDESQDINS